MAISAAQVKDLREATGAGMMDCKKALEEAGGDIEAAKDFLRKKGIAFAQKRMDRDANEGGVATRIREDGRGGSMVQLACETDFVARNEQFSGLLDSLTAQALQSGADNLADQTLNAGQGTVSEMLTDAIGKLGENLRLIQAVRVELEGEGVVGGYVHSNSRIGVLVALGSAKAVSGEALQGLAKDLAMHIAASQVSSISGEDIDPAVVEKEREIYIAQAKESGKPDDIVTKMVEGRMKKFLKEVTLLEQPFVKDPERAVKQLIEETGKSLDTSLTVQRYEKFQF